MGRNKPKRGRLEEILALAEREVARDCPSDWRPQAVEGHLQRTDAGRPVEPRTWSVLLRFLGGDGAPIRMDPSHVCVFVDDESGAVRPGPLAL